MIPSRDDKQGMYRTMLYLSGEGEKGSGALKPLIQVMTKYEVRAKWIYNK